MLSIVNYVFGKAKEAAACIFLALVMNAAWLQQLVTVYHIIFEVDIFIELVIN